MNSKTLVLVACLSACSDPEDSAEPTYTCLDEEMVAKYEGIRPDWPLVRQTEHLDIYVEPERFVCAGMAAELERHAVFVADMLGVEPRKHIAFFHGSLPDVCGAGNVGCTTGDGTAYGLPSAAYHELAHAVACQLRVDSPNVLTEGLARMFETAPLHSYAEGTDLTLYELLSETGGATYSYGAHFSRWLIDRGGWETYAELYTETHRNPLDADVIAGEIEALYSTKFEALEAEYDPSIPYMRAPFRQCSDIPHVDQGPDGSWRYASAIDCDDEGTMGPYERHGELDPGGYMYQSFTFTLEAETDLAFAVGGNSGFHKILLHRCGEDAATETDALMEFEGGIIFAEPNNTTNCPIGVGTWRADVLVWQDGPGSIDIEFHTYEEVKDWCQ